MTSLARSYFNPEEWKYIQAVLKYRLDLHFYLSQVQRSSPLEAGLSSDTFQYPSLLFPTSSHDAILPSSPTTLIQGLVSSQFVYPYSLSPPDTPLKLTTEHHKTSFKIQGEDEQDSLGQFPSTYLPTNSKVNRIEVSETEVPLQKKSHPTKLGPEITTAQQAIRITEPKQIEIPKAEFVLTEDSQKRFGCPFSGCDYKSNRKNNLQRHKETMHQVREVAFNCCSLQFYRRADFDKHKAKKHSQGYSCMKCDKHFERRATLARHERSHDKETPYWCPYCYYRNGNESNNRRHIRKHEDVIKEGVNSHWNPYSSLGSVAIMKEKLRPLDEIDFLIGEMRKNLHQHDSPKKRKTSTVSQLPDSTT